MSSSPSSFSNMSQPTCHVGFPLHPPSCHTHRTFFPPQVSVSRGPGWCSTTVQTTNSWSSCWVNSASPLPASTPWHSSRVPTTSHRPLHTWPTMPQNQPTQWRAVPTIPSGARTNTSFSCPRASRKQVRFSSPVSRGGHWRTSSENTPHFHSMRSAPKGVKVVSFQNENGPFSHSWR